MGDVVEQCEVMTSPLSLLPFNYLAVCNNSLCLVTPTYVQHVHSAKLLRRPDDPDQLIDLSDCRVRALVTQANNYAQALDVVWMRLERVCPCLGCRLPLSCCRSACSSLASATHRRSMKQTPTQDHSNSMRASLRCVPLCPDLVRAFRIDECPAIDPCSRDRRPALMSHPSTTS